MFDYSSPENYKKEFNRTLRKLFSGKIKGSFLIDIMYRTINLLGGQINEYYDCQPPDNKQVLSSTYELPFYDICRHIVGLHRSNLVFATEEERMQKENSDEYKDLLAKQALTNIQLREYGSVYFRRQPIVKGEGFIFFHTPYNLFVLCMRMSEILSSYNQPDFCNSIISSITNKGIASLTLLEDNFLDNAYPICRGIIELYIKLILLLNSQNTIIEHYYKFVAYELRNTFCDRKYPKEFNDLFENRKNKKCINKIDYLHYGWLDYIEDYHINGALPYSISGIITYLKKKFKSNEFFDTLKIFYKMCHGYTHGTLPLSKYPLLHYFEISSMLYYTIANTYITLCERLKIDTKINNIDIVRKIEDDFNQLQTQYQKRSTENFEAYYKLNLI